MIIAISGKIGSGKDTTANVIQWLCAEQKERDNWSNNFSSFNNYFTSNKFGNNWYWERRKFADKLKDIVCLLIGCTREQLEDREFKKAILGEDWVRYGYANGFDKVHRDGEEVQTLMNNQECSKEKYEQEKIINWQTAYKTEWTPRMLLQFIGTELFRNKILDNIWVNALFVSYPPDEIINKINSKTDGSYGVNQPNWIITDVRFPNEAKAVKDRGGIIIRVNRNIKIETDAGTIYVSHSKAEKDGIIRPQHESETALDDYEFDYTIDNFGTIDDLIENVKRVLIKEKII